MFLSNLFKGLFVKESDKFAINDEANFMNSSLKRRAVIDGCSASQYLWIQCELQEFVIANNSECPKIYETRVFEFLDFVGLCFMFQNTFHNCISQDFLSSCDLNIIIDLSDVTSWIEYQVSRGRARHDIFKFVLFVQDHFSCNFDSSVIDVLN